MDKAVEPRRAGGAMLTLEKLVSIRFWLVSLVIAGLPAVGLEHLWHPLIWLFWPLLVVVLFAGLASADSNPVKCPWCKKRVKLGSTACHHCGRNFGTD